MAFLAYHDNQQPRYYLVVAVPMTLLTAVVVDALWSRRDSLVPAYRFGAVFAAAVLAVMLPRMRGRRCTMCVIRSYTFASAAQQIHRIVTKERGHNPLVLSISGSDLSLMTGLPSICDDFGTMDLEDRVRVYQPAGTSPGIRSTMTRWMHSHRSTICNESAAFPAMDDPERNLLILYRPRSSSAESASRPQKTCYAAIGNKLWPAVRCLSASALAWGDLIFTVLIVDGLPYFSGGDWPASDGYSKGTKSQRSSLTPL